MSHIAKVMGVLTFFVSHIAKVMGVLTFLVLTFLIGDRKKGPKKGYNNILGAGVLQRPLLSNSQGSVFATLAPKFQ